MISLASLRRAEACSTRAGSPIIIASSATSPGLALKCTGSRSRRLLNASSGPLPLLIRDVVGNLAIRGGDGLKCDASYAFTMPAVGFRFRAHAGQRTSGALRRLACEVYNCHAAGGQDFHRRNGRHLTLYYAVESLPSRAG